MSDLADIISVERDGLRAMLERIALERENDAQAQHDARYVRAARSIRQIGATLDQVTDDMLVKLATVNESAAGLLSSLVAARLVQVGFELPLCEDAAAFFQPIEAQVDAIMRRARPHMH